MVWNMLYILSIAVAIDGNWMIKMAFIRNLNFTRGIYHA